MKNIEQYKDQIAEKGIMVVDNITEMPRYGQPYVSMNFVLGISHSGSVDGVYDMRPVHYRPKEISLIYPRHVVWAKKASGDYLTTLVVVSEKTYRELSSHIAFRNRFSYEQSPSFLLTDSQYDDMMSIIGAMRSVDGSDIPSRLQLMISLLDVLLAMTDHFRHQNERIEDHAPQRLSARFYQAITEHHRENHSVCFYAEKFFLSTKHFSDVIKKETGHSAKYWIGQFLVSEAKMLLQSRHDLNIQQISDLLGYEDQTSFSRHFKNATGVSPLSFRNGNSEP